MNTIGWILVVVTLIPSIFPGLVYSIIKQGDYLRTSCEVCQRGMIHR
jgi:hypothetical protein